MEDSLSCEKDPRSNPVVSPSLSSQGAAEWFGGGTTPFEELLSLLPLQTRHVERSEQENSKGIAPPPAGRRTLNLPADPLCVRERPVGARSLPELCLFFFFLSLLNWLRSGKPLFRHRGPFLFACLYEENGVWTFASEAFFGADRPESALCLTDWTTVQREESYFCSPSLCPFFYFWVRCFQTDWKAADFVCACVCVCECVCLSAWVCVYI